MTVVADATDGSVQVTEAPLRRAGRAILALLPLAALAGCSLLGEKKAPPPPIEFPMVAPYAEVRTLAIAPAINLSGSRDFDPLVVSDTLFAELQQVRGLNVLPLNKTLMVMQRLGVRSLDDPRLVQRVAELLGADGLIVPAVTAYDPYNPPTVGMILQLYTPPEAPRFTATTARPNVPTAAPDAAGRGGAAGGQPVAQVNGVFNATNQSVLHELHDFAAGRTEYDSALGDKKFLVDIDSYMRFVCHAMIRRLLEVERERPADR
jgi:hypothetical protein